MAGLTASRGVAAALQATTYVLVARASDPAGIGEVLAGLAVATAVVAVIDLGVSSHAMRELGSGNLDADSVMDLWVLRLASSAAGALIWVAVASSVNQRLVGVGPFLMAESLLGLTVLAAVASSRTRLAAVMMMLARALTLVLVIVATRSPVGLPWTLAAGSSAAVVVGTYALRGLAHGRTRPPRLSFRMIKDTWHYMTSGVLAQLTNLDVSIVAAVNGGRAAGLYGLPSRLTTPLTLVAQSHANIVLRQAAAAWSGSDSRELRAIRRSVVMVATACIVPLAALVSAAHIMVPGVLGSEYRGAIGPLRVIVIAIAIATVNGPLIAMLQAVGRSRQVSATLFVAVPVGLLCVAVGAMISGPVAAGAGLVAMQTLILARLWPALSSALAPAPDDLRP